MVSIVSRYLLAPAGAAAADPIEESVVETSLSSAESIDGSVAGSVSDAGTAFSSAGAFESASGFSIAGSVADGSAVSVETVSSFGTLCARHADTA